jgi:hypothetical protein
MKLKKKKKYEFEDVEFLPLKQSVKEKEKSESKFGAFWIQRRKNMSEKDRQYGKLMQLKYSMEGYADSNKFDETLSFGYFLNEYIHSLNKKKTQFSEEISLHSAQLSRLLSEKEDPNFKILVRLEIHSNNTIPALLWYRIIEKRKESELTNNHKLRISERKLVKAKAWA